MKKLLLTLFILPLFVLGQNSDVESKLKNTVWRISLIELDFHTIVVFEEPGAFGYISNVTSFPTVEKKSDKHQWSVKSSGSVLMKFTDNFLMCVGKMNSSQRMSGTFVNENGDSGTWIGELIKY
tara:strand:- start:1328 stop:1699 length:372 start_codon:yes stop_codon:yes gene_type:complete